MNSVEIIELENAHTSGVYAKQPIVFVRGQGALLWDADGNQYIDCAAGHGVANLGHAHPRITAALMAQSARLITLFETFPNDQRALLMKELTSLASGLDRVFFCNSGTESIEAAIKFARLSTGRSGIIATMRGFHGRTLGALSATWNKTYRTPFEPLVPGFSHVAYNNVEALAAAVNENTAAVILEPVQGEGGVYPAAPGYLESALEICHAHGALLIIDEVQTGFCRTGKMFAYQHSSITPDLLCCSKSIAGGIPMGAVLIGERVANLTPGTHGSTFGGNPLACAAALAALGVMKDEELAKAAELKGAYMMEKLQSIHSSQIREVRGKGLMIGIELKQKAAPYLKALQEKHILALNAGMTVIRLLPPLVITYAEIDHVIAALTEVLCDE